MSMPPRDLANLFEIRHRHGLAAARVVGNGHHHQRHILAAALGDQPFERFRVHVALEWELRLRVARLGLQQIDSLRAGEFDVSARGVEMRIVRNDVSRFAENAEQNALRRPPLMRGNHVFESRQSLGHALQTEVALAARVALVSAHHPRPLLGGHCARA